MATTGLWPVKNRLKEVIAYFTAIGMFSMPTEEELREQMAELTESKGA